MATLQECYQQALELGTRMEDLLTASAEVDMERLNVLIAARDNVLARAAALYDQGQGVAEAQDDLQKAMEQQQRLEQALQTALSVLRDRMQKGGGQSRHVREMQSLMRPQSRSRYMNEKR